VQRFKTKYEGDYEDAEWLDELDAGFDRHVHEVAAFDPERVLATRERCCLAEVARAWRYKKAGEQGWGWIRSEDRAD
jgi:hypothetical protein